MWENHHGQFIDRLIRCRLDKLLANKKALQSLRFDNNAVKWWLNKASYILDEKGVNLYEEIARACGQLGGDDEKSAL